MDVLIVFDWLRFAGRNLVQSKATNGKGGSLWNGEPGYSEQRWQFWKKRLQDVSNDSNYDMIARESALKAYGMLEGLLDA